jgi:hypothetical protein
MITDVDTALKDIADWYVKNRRSMTEADLEPILKKHCESEAEVRKFAAFLGTDPGQLRFKTLLKEPYAGLLTPGKFPKRDEALKKLGQVTIVEVHDDGDLTVRSGGKLYVVTTDGKTFEQTASYLKDPFIKVGERVRWIAGYYSLPRNIRLGTVVEYRPSYPGIQSATGFWLVEPTEDSAHVRWDDGAAFGIEADGEGKRWERIQVKPSYLKEAVAETECQLISPQYYDMLTWFNVPVPDYSFAIEPEVKERKIDEVLQKLKDGVSRIHESSVFREFLTTMSKFWEYSFGNQILIMLQRPGATRVAGFVTWKELGRHVKWGEKGIAILAPCLPPKALACPLCGNPFTERELRTHLSEVHRREDISALVREAREGAVAVPTPTYFKVVNVFDVSQTEGKPLPEIAVPVLSGAFSKELYDKLMTLASKHSLTVSFEPRPELDPAIKGMLLGKTIWVKGDEPEAQRLKTLAHEEAHYFTEAVYLIPRADAEVIAESVSFVVCAHSGFDTGDPQFPLCRALG